MEKLLKLAAAVCTTAALTGCTFGASIDTLMTPPKLGLEQEQIYTKLTDSLGASNISLKYPKSGKYLSAFIIEDIDGDGGNEAIVFYERRNHSADENPLRINILDKEGGRWRSVVDDAVFGSELEEVMISKLGSNDRINIIIGTSLINRSEKNVYIYNYANGILENPTFSESYSFIGVSDLDNDGENEFLRLKGASNGEPAAAEAYKLDSEGMYHKLAQSLSGSFTDFDSISYGMVGSRKGLYIDAVSGTGYVQSDIVYMDEKGMEKVFQTPEESARTIRPAGCMSFDVDGDGSIEIPIQTTAPGYEAKGESEQLRLTDWMQVTDDYRLEKRYTSYYSVNNGYIFIFPEKWVGKVSVMRDIVNDEIVFCKYSDEGMGRELLRIFCAEDLPSREDRISGGYMLMHTKGEASYLAFIPADNDPDGLSITAGDAAIGFRTRD
ncbi:MAG: hypothetical protein K6G33_06980 [Ruminococcus sp.]|uniref:hypothetical protein n=1 Tax=Ruminococcus sp. TaxID=41978 RepID=UPI0025DB2A70|nr:hypothetical protein [Ruminococcus sp.]MCR5600464.1 hypothetical protein [Ruminococcus sp.]